MTIKNILVSYNGSKMADAALETALIMAERYQAHLTGILAHGLPSMLYAYGGHVPQAAIDQLEAADREHRKDVKTAFFKHCAAMPDARLHFLDVYGEADETLMDVALGYDLVVLGPVDKASSFAHMDVHPDVIARNSGKPVLMVPEGYDPTGFNENMLLAWDGKRAAARALNDALSLLQPEAALTLLTIGAPEWAEAKAKPAMQHLQRHGYAPKLITRKAKKIAKAILSIAKDEGAGLLVMGAYEHAKLAEDLFGGVTNTVLKKSEIPVLLSH
jgi:nucleotide-binding universal stress UspA family protein